MMLVISVDAYLRDASNRMQQPGYTFDCVTHATELAELLLQAGRAPWIGRLRDTRETDKGRFHGRLTPVQVPRFTWTTHYVCCADDEVYDPIAGEPLPVETYAECVFGRPLPVEQFLSSEATKDLLRRGELRRACR